jgi:hypothetical protein
MRNFTNLSALPGGAIVVDGEAYQCPDFRTGDFKGSVRTVPADRILAVHWHGEHGHGHVEGFGTAVGFTDKSQLEPYVRAWLKARAIAKREAADALVRKQVHDREAMGNLDAAISDVEAQVADTAKASDANSAAQVNVAKSHLARLVADRDRIAKAMTTDGHVAVAAAAADEAEKEAADAG